MTCTDVTPINSAFSQHNVLGSVRLTLDVRIMSKQILKKWDGSMDWIDLAQDRDRWRDFLNVIMSLRVS